MDTVKDAVTRLCGGVPPAPASGWKGLGQCIAGVGGRRTRHVTQPSSSLLPSRGLLCKAAKPPEEPCTQVPSAPSWSSTGGIRSPAALVAASGITVQEHRPFRYLPPTRAAPPVPQLGGHAQARDQPSGDRARGDLQLRC